MPTSLVVFRLAESEGNIAVFDHMLDLSPHYMRSALGIAKRYEGVHLLVKLNRIMK